MKLEIFEQTMCCASGVCGPSVDEKLINLNEDLETLKNEGVIVERYQPHTHSMNFMMNPIVSNLIREKGQEILPITVLNGKIIKTNEYASLEEVKSNI